jgi:predicted acylesterase/phospholipase RssA
MTIKHIVISGGGPAGILSYGVASQLAKKGFWHVSDIKSMYGCSIGAYMCVILALNYDWDWVNDYFIKRPWDKLVAVSTTRLTEIYEKKCLLNEHFYKEAITPLLRAKDLSDTITLAEFYAYNKIDLHMYATNINDLKMKKIDLSHKTHPDLSLIKALRMTMAVPVIFEPIFIDDACYVDGGLMNNFPLNDCIEQQECDTDEILGIKNIWKEDITPTSINEKSSIFDFLLEIIKKMRASIDIDYAKDNIKYVVNCFSDEFASVDKWAETLSNESMRKKLVEKGCEQADLFLAYINTMSKK